MLLHDPFPGAVERGLAGMQKSLERLEAKGGASAAEALGRVTETSALAPADLMIEAIVEDVDAKLELFRAADEVLPAHAILASNTSSIPITTLAAATSRPDQVIGMHFFNPVPVLQLVEVIRAAADVRRDGRRDRRPSPAISARSRPRRTTSRASSRTES